jgi:beta-glucosidase
MSAETTRAPGAFPDGFLWGAATSAYQVEGSPLADGAGPSNWHRFAHRPGTIKNGDTGDVACDHYRRYPRTSPRWRALGLGAYRFSISWSRVMPEGRGRVNPQGLAFYARLVDALLAAGIEPVVTLFHWDLPAALEDLGGWLNRDSSAWFADYTRVVVEALGDRVPMWATLNEPWVVVDAAYLHGIHPPGHRSRSETALAAHHLMRAHGASVQAFRAHGRGRIGLVVNLEPKVPASDDPADVAATERADAYFNRQFLDAALLGLYPESLARVFGDDWPAHPAEDMALIAQPIDWVGINYYTRGVMRHDDREPLTRASKAPVPGATYTETGWEIYPAGLRDTLVRVTRDYGRIPLYVTENGVALDDPLPGADGIVDDPVRVAYLRDHLRACREAIAEGVDLRGYFVWSLIDNFEWQNGYSKRFGLLQLDRATQRRTLKRSALYYRDVIRARGARLDDEVARA